LSSMWKDMGLKSITTKKERKKRKKDHWHFLTTAFLPSKIFWVQNINTNSINDVWCLTETDYTQLFTKYIQGRVMRRQLFSSEVLSKKIFKNFSWHFKR
jgi:hypothetical protein